MQSDSLHKIPHYVSEPPCIVDAVTSLRKPSHLGSLEMLLQFQTRLINPSTCLLSEQRREYRPRDLMKVFLLIVPRTADSEKLGVGERPKVKSIRSRDTRDGNGRWYLSMYFNSPVKWST